MKFLLSKGLRRVSRLYNRTLNQLLPELQSENEADILLTLATESGNCTQKQLTAMLQVDKSRVAVLVSSLCQRGLIYTEADGDDRRSQLLFLTPQGEALLPRIQQAITEVNTLAARELNETQLEQFETILARMQANLNH